MRSSLIFAGFGFIAALVQAIGREQPVAVTIRSGLGWALGFGLLGWGIGRAARAIAQEAIPEERSRVAESRESTEGRNEETAWVRPSERHAEETTPPSPAPSPVRAPDEQRV